MKFISTSLRDIVLPVVKVIAAFPQFKEAREYKKKVVESKGDLEKTADVTKAEAIAESKKHTFPKPKNAVVDEAMKALDMTTPEHAEEENMKDKDAKATKAAAVGK